MLTYIPENYDELLKHEYGDYKIKKIESFNGFVDRHKKTDKISVVILDGRKEKV